MAPPSKPNGYSDAGESPQRRDSLDWRAKVELFEEIRREYEFGVGTIAGVAKKLKVHRRMVREAIGSALPKPRKSTERPRWKLTSAPHLWTGFWKRTGRRLASNVTRRIASRSECVSSFPSARCV